MKRILQGLFAALFLAIGCSPILNIQMASAASLQTETFTGNNVINTWLSGGNPNSACLTASSSSSGNIPGCDTETAIDTSGNGALRLTSNANNQAGFVINQTPVSTEDGLEVSFDMYQYNGSGADGIAFFLIDGSTNPTQPGAFGGSLGYSNNNTGTAGLVGGYVGVGFDVYGNFSSSNFGTGGPGAQGNSITVRGSQGTGYQYVTRKAASYTMANNSATARTNAKRHVTISISTNNIMTVYVDYNNGQGTIKELSNINLATINGANSLPASLKFGFSASTGGSNNIHEISGLNVATLSPNVRANASQTGTWRQGETGQYTITASNDAGAEATNGEIVVTDTISSPVLPVSASGDGWDCTVYFVHSIRCTRPGSGANALLPGASLPVITVNTTISGTAPATVSHNTVVSTPDNSTVNGTDNFANFTIAAGDRDGASSTVENAAPNAGDANDDSIADNLQTYVTSFVNPVTSNYVVLETNDTMGGCDQNVTPVVADVSENAKADADFTYPVGMMDFSITCTTPGGSAIITQYYYGDYDAAQFVARKYYPTTQSYIDIPGAVVSNVTIGGEQVLKVVYNIEDGGLLDDDGAANGTIVDPAGPAIRYVASAAAGGGNAAPANAAAVGAPDTGFGIGYTDPAESFIAYGVAALILSVAALAVRLHIKRYS